MATDAQRFFAEYAQAASGQDPEDVASFYDKDVLHAGPNGTRAFHNDARYRAWILKLLKFNEDCGLEALVAKGVGAYDLGPALVIATVQWQVHFARAERPAEFTVTYLLRRAPDGLRILCAAAHDDQEEQMRRLGVTSQGRPARGTKRGRRKTAKTSSTQ